MTLYLTARHIELTEALRRHVDRHLLQPVEGVSGLDTVRMEIQLYRTSEREIRFGCHILVELAHRQEINIREEDHDLYETIDLAQKRLLQALTEHRERRLTQGRHPRKYSWERFARALGWLSRRASD